MSAENNEGEFKNKIISLIDPEKLKTLYLEMLCEVGCKVMLYTFAEDAICDGDKILGATVINKSLEETITMVVEGIRRVL